MTSKFLLILFLAFSLNACKSKAKTDPLLIPPSYGQLPTEESLTQENQNSDEDLQELKDLLLQN